MIQDVHYKPKYKNPEEKSAELRDFVEHALCIRPEGRWSAERLLEHHFIKTHASDSMLSGLNRLVIAARDSIVAKNAAHAANH